MSSAPARSFGEFFFTETGDTNATSAENDTAGGWGSLFKLAQSSPSADTGKLSVFFKGNQPVTGPRQHQLPLEEPARRSSRTPATGCTRHANALDSGYSFDVTADYSNAQNQPVRWLAEGRDASATLDSATGGFGKNEGDNELTGLLVSDGDPGVGRHPRREDARTSATAKWRWFYTQQHGDNPTYEVLVGSNGHGHGDD